VNIFHSAFAVKLVFVLGIVNLVSVILILFTCRCLPGLKIFSGKLMQNPFYKQIFKYHCYLWWIFGISVIVHAVFAIGSYGVPF
jgi:hypothetical protein